MKNDKTKFLLCVLFFALLAIITFRCTWPEDHVFSTSDLNIGQLAFLKYNLPTSLTGYFIGCPVLGNSGSGYKLFSLLLACLPMGFFGNAIYGFILLLGSTAMVWFLRMWNRSWLSAIFGALVAFWVNSILLATVGHAYKMEVLAFSVLALCLVEKAVRAETFRRAAGYSMLGGVAVGIMMIEQQDVALLAGLFLASYAFFRLIQVHGRAVIRWLVVLMPLGAVALLLSGSTVMKSYASNIAGAASVQQSGDEKWNYVTQWSAVPEEWPDLVALGWGGWSTGNPEGPYWGKLGRSAEWEETGQGFQNFKLNSVYFGIVPFLMGLVGLAMAVRERKTEDAKVVLFWGVAGLLGFWLAFGKYSLLYKLFYHLPMVGNIRAPIKLLDNFQICLGIVSAYGLDRLLCNGGKSRLAKVAWIAGGLCGVLMLSGGMKVMMFPAGWTAKFAGMGYEPYVEKLLRCMSNAWLHAGMTALLFSVLVFLLWKGVKPAKWAAIGFIALIAADSLILTSHHFKADDISAMKRGNNVINYLKANQGNERTFFVDSAGIYNQWLASDGPYHGLNLFNIWQMPRMPVEYKEYLGKVGRNQIRLWQLSAVKYIAAPAGIMEQLKQNPALAKLFQPVFNYQVPTAQGVRTDVLLEFKGTIPRFALYHNWQPLPLEQHCETLASPQYDPGSTVLVDADADIDPSQDSTVGFQPMVGQVTKRSATVKVHADSPTVLRFSQRYQSSWKVFIDGRKEQLLRLDYLCMGALVPPGDHVVEFQCVSNRDSFVVFAVTLIVSLSLSTVLICGQRRE